MKWWFHTFGQFLFTFSFCLYCTTFYPKPHWVPVSTRTDTYICVTHARLSCDLLWLHLLGKLPCNVWLCDFSVLLCADLENIPGMMAGISLISSMLNGKATSNTLWMSWLAFSLQVMKIYKSSSSPSLSSSTFFYIQLIVKFCWFCHLNTSQIHLFLLVFIINTFSSYHQFISVWLWQVTLLFWAFVSLTIKRK